MKAAYLKAPFQFELRDYSLREPKETEVEIKVKACGFCGHDMILCGYKAQEFEPFGHEFSGIVTKTGSDVKDLKPGDKVTVESSIFNPISDQARNGSPELDMSGLNYITMDRDLTEDSMGCSEATIVPAELCVKFDGISFEEASLIEPLGVARDLVRTADIKLNDDVLLIGAGTIGLMALQLAKASGARNIYVSQNDDKKRKCELAMEFGAKAIVPPISEPLSDYEFPRGGVDKILLTAPPKTISSAIYLANIGGIIAYIGIGYGERGMVTFDSELMHAKKLQLRASNAIPALYFPECIDMVKSGMVNVDKLISHRIPLNDISKGVAEYLDDLENQVKAIFLMD